MAGGWGGVRAAVIEVGRWPLKFYGLLMRIRLQGFGQSPLHSLSSLCSVVVGVLGWGHSGAQL